MPDILRTMRADLVKIIQESILSKEYVPGQRLREEDIVERFGVSRTPIREAFVVLEQEGLVEIRPHRGVYVATFTRDEIVDLLSIESVMEGLAASLAAQNATDEQIATMEELLGTAKTILEKNFDSEEFYRYDRKFHHSVVVCSGSQTISRVLEKQLSQIYLCRYYTITTPNRFAHSIREHHDILESIKKRDPASAERAARYHMESVKRDFINSGRGFEEREEIHG
jgi:DNA-binding GntR family transcriptional regulator